MYNPTVIGTCDFCKGSLEITYGVIRCSRCKMSYGKESDLERRTAILRRTPRLVIK